MHPWESRPSQQARGIQIRFVSNVFMPWNLPRGYCGAQFTDLLGVCVGKGQTEVVLLQQVEVLTHHVHQGLSFGVFLQKQT